MNKSLLFIHGSGDSSRIWHVQVEHFGPQRAVAIDLPGHGQRPDSLPTQVAVQDYAQAVFEIANSELRLEQPIIVGHSLGGAIALAMALEYGTALGGLGLIGTGARLRVHPSLLEDARNAPQQARIRLAELSVAQISTSAQTATQEQMGLAPTMLYRDLAACNVFDVMAQLPEIALPALIICGAEDRLTPVKYSEYLHKQIAGSTLHIVPDAGHYVMRDQPEAFNRALEQWLRAL